MTCQTVLRLLCNNSMTKHHYVIILNLCLVLLGSTQALGFTPEPVTTHPALDYQPSVSADGQTMAFTSLRSGNADIWVQTLKSSALSTASETDHHSSGQRSGARLNKAGTRLLYVSHKSDPRGDVYLLDLITREEQQLTDLTSGDSSPQWDQEEEGFFYLKRDPLHGTSAIFRKSLSDPEEEMVVPQATSFSSNHDGQLLYSNDTGLTLMTPARQPLNPTQAGGAWPESLARFGSTCI